MAVNKAVHRLHVDLSRLRKAERELKADKKDHRKDEKELRHDRNELKKDRKQGDRMHKVADAHKKELTRDTAAMKKELGGIEKELHAVMQRYNDGFEDPAQPGVVQHDPNLLAQANTLQQKELEVAQKWNTEIAGDRAKLKADHEHILGKRAEIKKDIREIKHDKKVVAHDHKELKHDHKAVHNAHHKAIKDLRPAEYHMGLKGTNKARKELGLKSVDHVIRPATPGNATATMKRLAAAGRAAAMSMGGYTSHGLCATGVSRAISNAMGIAVYGNGNQIDNNLPRSKFKEVHMPLAQALKIPGLVLTWEHTSTQLGSIYGHTAITTGDGHTSCSDFIETNTLAGAASRTGLRIFMPTT